MKTYPLTESQLGMFLEWDADRSSTQYAMGYEYRLPATVDTARLERAIRAYVDAHPVFRTRLVETEDGVRQYVDTAREIPFDHLEMSDAEADARAAALPRAYDLFNDPLIRFELVTTPSGSRLLVALYHLIADGTMTFLTVRGVSALYNGETPVEESSLVFDLAERERASFETEEYRAAAAAARERFAGRTMTVAEGHPEAAEAARGYFEVFARFPRAEVDGFCRANALHPNLFMMGVFARTLALFANEREVVFTTFNHGRKDPALKTTLGLLVKCVPVLGELKGDRSLVDFCRSFRLHQAGVYPFTHCCRDLGMKTGWGFVFQDGTVEETLSLGGEQVPAIWHMNGGSGECPTTQIFGERDAYLVRLTAAPGRYGSAELQAFANRFAVIARNFVHAGATTALKDISVLTAAETETVLALSKGEDLDYDKTKTFVDLFEAQAQAQPAAIAVVDEERSLSYEALDQQANALAAVLQTAGVSVGGFVGVMLPRTVAFPVAMIAVQKCGAGYVPMDAAYPAERLAYMLENSAAPVLVTTHALWEGKEIAFKGKTIFVEDLPAAPAARINRTTPESPAYMIYTSGSTGKPKGVVLPQRALTAMLAWFVRDCGLKPGKKNLSITSFSFDASVPDLFPPLAAGGELHILSEELRKDLEGVHDYAVRVGATGLTTSTQLGLALVNTYPELPLEYMMLGGEKMVPFAKTPVRMLNGYGPTEFAVCSSYHEVDQTRVYDIPIGRAVANSSSLIVDKLGQPVPRGMTGELALVGLQLANGYWQLPEKTAQVFVDGLLGRMYRTGDLARYNADGELEFLGRIDFQVKLRGFRIEIGEIEHAAASFPGVGAVAAEVKDVSGTKHLVLYFEGAVDAAALKSKMAETLTSYMVPDFFVGMEKLPLTPNGKIDRRRLPVPKATDEPVVAPETEMEKRLSPVAAAVLGLDRLGVTQDFNRLGLTSLGAMSLLAKIKKEIGCAVTMKQLVAHPTVRQLAAFLAPQAETSSAAPKKTRPRRATYPMTENQRGIYADWLRNPDALQYNVPAAFRFPGVKGAALAAAAEKVFAAHPAFGTRFGEKNGELVQFRPTAFAVTVPVERLAAEPDAAFFGAAMRPFKPTGEDLARGRVYESPTAAFLFIDIHHTVFDGFSVGLFLEGLIAALDGKPVPEEEYTVFEAALDERDYLESELVDEDDKWFARYLEGCESTSYPTSASGADGKPGEAGRVRFRLPAAAITARTGEVGVTASDWFLTAFTELLKRVGREEKVLVNFVTAGRTNPDVQEAVGMFVKTLPLRGISSAATFTDAARQMHASVAQLIDRERQSFVRLSEKFGVRPEILFAFEGGIFDLPKGASLLSPDTGTVKAPLTALVTPGKDDFELTLEYDRSLYAAADMERLVRLFGQLALNAATVSAETDLKKVPLLSAAETAEVVTLSRGADIAYDATKTVVNLIHANALARPFATAVVDCDGSITYGELDARSDALAVRLQAAGVKPGGFVGLMLPRRTSFVVSFLAVQKCGAGYVPMDAEYPVDRLAYMLEDSEAPVLVTTRALVAGKQIDFKGTTIFFEEVGDAVPAGTAKCMNLATPATPAYMIYTSGSTGRPKGVVIPHRALRHFCAWAIELTQLRPGVRVVTHPSFSFDASAMDLFPSLAVGAELHIYPEALRKDLAGMRDYIVEHAIFGGTMSTQIGMTLLDTYPDLPLSYLVVGGEKLLPIQRTAVRILNGYGPTEFTVCSSVHLVDQSQEGDIPIGTAAPGTYSLVVDRYGQFLPRGFAGELALAGPQIAEGYWHLPEKTAQTFVASPLPAFVDDPLFHRMYRTGDLARYNDQGTLDYLGRLDFQVKLRGFRIEIGEIEHRASTFDGVKGVAAEVRDVGGAKHLVLYYGSEAPLDEAALKAHLAAALTEYMVPDFFVRMDPLPLTPNGKINRKLLPTPSGEAAQVSEWVEPANELERKIAEAYRAILKLEKFGATTDFFAAGGTSLIGIKAVVALQKLGLEVQYGDLFKYKTPRALAGHLDPSLMTGQAASSAEKDVYADYDYTAIDKLLMATPTELFEGFRRHSLGDVLLCGATGYLGIHVLRYLLEATDAAVYALVRSKRGVGAEKRLDSQYVYYFGEKVPRRFKDRLSFVEGDITDAALGENLKDLSLGTVINCAALVKHYVADDLMDRINVGGVENLVAICAAKGARLIHASTYSVGGTIRMDSAAVLDERHLYVGQESDNDYVRTKFLAERAVLAATAAGKIRGKVMRLGNLMGRESDGEFQMNVGANAFVNSLKSYRSLGAYPLEEMVRPIEMSPIDRVAEAICLLSTTPDGLCVFHPYNAYALDMGAVIGAMNRCGFAIDGVSRKEFAARVDALRNDPKRAAELQGILHYAGHLLKDRRMTPAPNAWTTAVLYRLGFRWRSADENYLTSFLEMLEGLAVFD